MHFVYNTLTKLDLTLLPISLHYDKIYEALNICVARIKLDWLDCKDLTKKVLICDIELSRPKGMSYWKFKFIQES